MRRFTFTINAGETKNFKIAGNYFEIVSAQYAIDAEFYDRDENQQSNQALAQGVSGDWQSSEPGQPYAGFKITSANAQVVTLFVGHGVGGSKRLPGIVEVVDGGKARSLAGSAFSGHAYVAAVAGQYATAQLWNPAGSGKNAIVSQVLASNTTHASISMIMRLVAASIPTLVGNALAKKGGAAASIAEMRSDVPLVATITNSMGRLGFGNIQGNTYRFTEPLVLPPGYGLTTQVTNVPAADLGVTFEFIEETI